MMEGFFSALPQYGALGLFVVYLVYDRQIVLKSLKKSLEKNTEILHNIATILKTKK